MKIGIIGAGISGLTAGRILTRAGHDVRVFEKSSGYGGRMSTRRTGNGKPHIMDHGVPYLTGQSDVFRAFISELEEKKIVTKWTDTVSYYSEGQFFPESPRRESQAYYIAPDGMNAIGKYLGRWLDMYLSEKVGGLTYIGGSRIKKSPWMINSSTINVFESDAVIIATPAVQAYGLVATSQDELDLRKMISVLDEIPYSSTYSFMAGYGTRKPVDWKQIVCDHPVLSWIGNESSKRNSEDDCNIVAHSSDEFARSMRDENEPDTVQEHIMGALGQILGSWAGRPEWCISHLWRYHLPGKSLEEPFLESENELAPLAIIGDYFQGQSLEAAYLSGYRLGNHWVNKLS